MSEIWRPQLMTVEEIKQYDEHGNCVWEAHDLTNTWHVGGQKFVLSVAFDKDGGFSVPKNYYLGLDARATVADGDTLDNITGEPTGNGYIRQAISSSTGFSVTLVGSTTKATSTIVDFEALGGPWGHVSRLFFATSSDDSGVLISTVSLNAARIVPAGQTMSAKINLSLNTCS